jgi:POT family proton-dependent oligopeptide transporter
LTDRIQSASSVSSDLFGHPKGLTFLFSTEMWERFSYYGMRALLVLYMTKYLLLPGQAANMIGLSAVKRGLESVFGPLDVQPLSSQIYGFYTALVYFTPIFGGILADRVLGQRRTVIIGAILMAIGHFMMAVEQLFLFALLALILGSGAFKPNIATQVGGLYPPGDRRRDRVYSIFYVGINIGAFFSPLVCGTLGEEAGWHYGFAAAGVGMCIGLCIYIYALPLLPPDELQKAAHVEKKPLDRDEWRGIFALLVLFVPTTLFWAVYEQQGNTIVLWADANTDRSIDLFGFTAQIPTTWFLAVNPFLIFAFTPFVVALWTWQAKVGHEPSTVIKMAIGCLGAALAYLLLAAAAFYAGGGKTSWLWLFSYFVLLTIGEVAAIAAFAGIAIAACDWPLRAALREFPSLDKRGEGWGDGLRASSLRSHGSRRKGDAWTNSNR